MLRRLSICLVLQCSSAAFAQVAAPEPSTPDPYAPEVDIPEVSQPITKEIGSQIFFDAQKTGFTNDMKHQVFEGDVVAIGAGTLIAADKVQLDRTTNVVEARGHLVILSRNQLFLGDSVIYHLATSDFEINNAVMLTNDQAEIDRVTRRIFGFSAKEVEFEQARKARLADIEELKSRIRREGRRQASAGAPLSESLVDRYALLLEQEDLVKTQVNPSLARFPNERREAFKRRRDFWDASQKSSIKVPEGSLGSSYFHLEGEQITRANGNDYIARNALFTPCLCGKDESPAWAFRADEVDAQVGGYADLSHPVLEIKGVPVLYLPHLKIPIKDRRQSGFLMPTFGYETRSGNIYSQPVYFDLGPSSDATLTTDVFENRGTRLGAEYRTQQRESSGWELQIEGIRDRLWMDDRGLRDELGNMYESGLSYAADPANQPLGVPGDDLSGKDKTREWLKSRKYWEDIAGGPITPGDTPEAQAANAARLAKLNQSVGHSLAEPENTWRGSYAWRGVTYLAPRLSLVSNGEVDSDHRYSEELHVPDDFREAFFGGRVARAFSTANAQMHLDGKDFYTGLGTQFGDNYLLDERFQGQQMPLRLKVQSRYYLLVPPGSPLKVYGQLTGENIRINEYKSEAGFDEGSPTLGDGNWRRIKLDTVTPLVTDRIIQVSQFTDLEARYIEAAGLSAGRSEIRSWRAGVEFRLPIDGKGELPRWMTTDGCVDETPRPSDCYDPDDPEAPKKMIHHIMDWRLRFSARPSVVRNGPYTDPEAGTDPATGQLAYFSGDVPINPNSQQASVDSDVPDEERMQLHRRVTLFTDQVWKLLKRGWQKMPGTTPPAAKNATARDPAERARRELLYDVDRPLSDTKDLYDEANKQWLIDRYQLADDYYDMPLTFRSDVGYDFIDASAREKVRKENSEPGASKQALPEAWKPVNAEVGLHFRGLSLLSNVSYNVYLKQSVQVGHNLTLPAFFLTNVSLGYTIGTNYDAPNNILTKNYVRTMSVASTLIPPVTTYLSVGRQDRQGEEPSYRNRFDVAYGFKYDSSSQCWGLQFSREKPYNRNEDEAKYLLQLSIVFMGQQRNLTNMSSGIVRDVTGHEPAKY